MNAVLRLAKNSNSFARLARRLVLVLLIVGLVEPLVAAPSMRPEVTPDGVAWLQSGQVHAASTERTAHQTAVIATTAYLPLVSSNEDSWAMVGANPERNGWTTGQFDGNVQFLWWRPIDAFIPPSFQVVAANDLVYMSSARGLYALKYDTGAIVWRYDTEIPLGNAPTIATVNGTSVAIVGGYDKKIHAFNAVNGTPVWESPMAKAGFDANPLVINNTVYIGNRDGYFYAYNAANGNLVWQYPQANQDPLGPIHLSPAYKNGVIYFADGNNYAYALNESGTTRLKWKSQKLVGDGYDTYYPVIYTDTSVTPNKDYVIFSANIAYRELARPGTKSMTCEYDWAPGTFGPCESFGMYGYMTLNPLFNQVTLSDPWATGKTILDYTPLLNNITQKPWLRTYTVLDGSNGSEPNYFPVHPIENPSTQQPPIVGPDNLIYVSNLHLNGRVRVMGWKFGTPYFALSTIDRAGDEPYMISGGGNFIFHNLCCSRTASYISINNLPNNEISLWPYGGNSLGDPVNAPGYDDKLYYLGGTNELDNINAQFGNVNGIYGYVGAVNPIITYKGKLFVHQGNSVIAIGSGTKLGKLPLIPSSAPVQNLPSVTDAELKNRLAKEIQKIMDAGGLLKPGYYQDSMFSDFHRELEDYFENPGDTLYTLSLAYPYLSSTLQSQVKNFLKNTFIPKYYQPKISFNIGWSDGVSRTAAQIPPEVEADFANFPQNTRSGYEGRFSWFAEFPWINPNNFYALWKYALNVAPEDKLAIYQIAKKNLTTGECDWVEHHDCSKLPSAATDSYLQQHPYETNAYIAGYNGFLELQKLVNITNPDADDTRLKNNLTSELNKLIDFRINYFSKDSPYTTYNGGYGHNSINISRNFIWLTPELGALMNSRIESQIQTAIDEYNTVGSYWFVSRFNSAVAESGFQNLYDYPAIFQAKAWILRESREELTKWLDVPAFERGDLFYMQNLVAAIEAPSSISQTTTPQASLQGCSP